MTDSKKVGLTIFDIDETLFHTEAKVQVLKEGNIVKILDNQKYNSYKLKEGESFDYGQFKSAKIFKETSTPIAKVIKRAKRIIHFATRKGSKVIIVTARQDMDDKKLFKEAFPENFSGKKPAVSSHRSSTDGSAGRQYQFTN